MFAMIPPAAAARCFCMAPAWSICGSLSVGGGGGAEAREGASGAEGFLAVSVLNMLTAAAAIGSHAISGNPLVHACSFGLVTPALGQRHPIVFFWNHQRN